MSYSEQQDKKKAKIDSITIHSVSEYFGKLLTVIFSQNDINIISGEPDFRRRFFDGIISKIDSNYFSNINDYKKIIIHRNHLLKQIKINGNKKLLADLDSWDLLLSEKAVIISEKREHYVKVFNRQFAELFRDIIDDGFPVEIKYMNTLHSSTSFEIMNQLIIMRKKDIHLGWTSVGPHRDDYILINSRARFFNTYASQGQRRIAAILLKINEAIMIGQVAGKQCILLIDDVFNDIDYEKQKKIMSFVFRGNQIIFAGIDFKHQLSDNAIQISHHNLNR